MMTFLRLSVCGISWGLHYLDLFDESIFANFLLLMILQVFSIDRPSLDQKKPVIVSVTTHFVLNAPLNTGY